MLAAANWIVLRFEEHENLIDIATVNLAATRNTVGSRPVEPNK